MPLDPDVVSGIHLHGGTILGSSRGPRDPSAIADQLQKLRVDALFVIGGDGTMRGAAAIDEELRRRGARIAVIGVPKTIDNDLPWVDRTFGFETAVSRAVDAIRAAHIEAVGARHGVGIVKLMGRHAGFIAANAALASGDVNLVLVPEIPFAIHGEGGVTDWLRRRLARRGHAVIVVAEGAGQDLLPDTGERDPSGNRKLGDIGVFLRDELRAALADMDVVVKYIDPSYIVRAAPANAGDALFCSQLAEHAVHAAMAGRTGMLVGHWAGCFTHVPLAVVNRGRKRVDPDGPLWRTVVERTGQPMLLGVGG